MVGGWSRRSSPEKLSGSISVVEFLSSSADGKDEQIRSFEKNLSNGIGAGESTLADDVGADEDGNTYVTDVLGSKIWKVSPDGEPLSIIKNATFIQRPGTWNNLIGLNGIIYHPNGYLLVIHTTGGDLFKVEPRTGAVSVVKVLGSLKRGDGLELLSPTRLAVAGMPTRLVESTDDWETARVTGRYVGPAHRVGTSATVKDGDVYVNYVFGFGLGRKKTHVIGKAVFAPL
ncbi:uncharacterized protein LOC124673251 [Lolium rigidum]|uniref:uncharacterized protein LOC124673251 n=1 Tax=Lolium rigidum TaxID=89674 RepID=UPI001F5C741D|nr:uncharacterized protein LOC124673251 [Lolium rigidum]